MVIRAGASPCNDQPAPAEAEATHPAPGALFRPQALRQQRYRYLGRVPRRRDGAAAIALAVAAGAVILSLFVVVSTPVSPELDGTVRDGRGGAARFQLARAAGLPRLVAGQTVQVRLRAGPPDGPRAYKVVAGFRPCAGQMCLWLSPAAGGAHRPGQMGIRPAILTLPPRPMMAILNSAGR